MLMQIFFGQALPLSIRSQIGFGGDRGEDGKKVVGNTMLKMWESELLENLLSACGEGRFVRKG
jgi:hypothetical protein